MFIRVTEAKDTQIKQCLAVTDNSTLVTKAEIQIQRLQTLLTNTLIRAISVDAVFISVTCQLIFTFILIWPHENTSKYTRLVFSNFLCPTRPFLHNSQCHSFLSKTVCLKRCLLNNIWHGNVIIYYSRLKRTHCLQDLALPVFLHGRSTSSITSDKPATN